MVYNVESTSTTLQKETVLLQGPKREKQVDFSDVSEFLPVILTIVGVIALQFFMRRGRGGGIAPNRNIIQGFMSDIRINLRLVEILENGEQIKRFSVTAWKLYKDKIDFLNQPVQTALTEAYEIAEDYNQQVAANKRFKTAHYIANINTGKMKERLQKGLAGLEDWLLQTTGSTDPAGKSGFFDGIIGSG